MPSTEDQARHNLQVIVDAYNLLSDSDRKAMTEASVVRQFIDRLLREVLGWPIDEPARYKYELYTQAGRPDVTLIPEAGGVIFLEAKKFGAIKELAEARTTTTGIITPGQLALPGMAVDRTPEEQQAINYAFQNGGTWAILCNFEKLRLFNARRDWLVLSFETPEAYLRDFDLLWQLAYHNILKGSLDVLSSQRHREEVDRDYLNFINIWREELAKNIIVRRGQNAWAFDSAGQVRLPVLRAAVQRFLDRLVIIRFAEDHLVLKPGTLGSIVDHVRENPYSFAIDEHVDRFFRRFDQTHNSALFSPGIADEASFGDETLRPLIEKLYEARYRAMPADILGNTYEQFLGKTLVLDNGTVKSGDNLETRKKQGSYYTPQVIVRYIVDNSLGRFLYGTENGRPDGQPAEGETRKTSADIRDLRVLDSACGSGSFLIYAYYVLQDFYEGEMSRLEQAAARRIEENARQGMTQLDLQIEVAPLKAEIENIRDYPRLILEKHLYGVDLDPQAAEIAVVNLMMRALEGRHQDKRLPLILNQNVKVGNSLVGLRYNDPRLTEHSAALAEIHRLREALTRAPHGPEHDRILSALEDATAQITGTLDEGIRPHFTDMERVRPFHWGAEFPEVFYNPDGTLKDNPGFTVIFGNPPWEILKPDLREFYAQFDARIESAYTRARAEQRIAELDAEDTSRADLFRMQTRTVSQTAAYTRAVEDYTRQGRGDPATHKLFIERSYTLLRDGGRLGYVVPSGIYTDLGTKELRQMLLTEGSIQYIFSFSNERFFFPGVDHRFKFALVGAHKGQQSDGFWAAFRFNPRVAIRPDDLPAFLAARENLIYMRRDVLEKFSPDSLSVMEFEQKNQYAIAEKLFGNWPLLGKQIESSWNAHFAQDFHITNDRDLFNHIQDGLPLYEGKMIQQFNASARGAQYWVNLQIGKQKLQDKSHGRWFENYRFAFREIARSTDSRTSIAAMLPKNVFATITLWTGTSNSSAIDLYIVSVFNSFCFDFLARSRVGTHMTLFLTKQLPLPRLTAGDPFFDALVPRAARLTCTRVEFAGLWQEVMGEPWDESKGATDPAERQRLRDEIDALVAHLYGLSRAEFDHILGTFPLVFPATDAGASRRAALLATYDRFAEAPFSVQS